MKIFGTRFFEAPDHVGANAAVSDSFDKAPADMEREGAKEPQRIPLSIEDPEVLAKIRSIAGKMEPMEFIARTGMAVSQIKTLSVEEIQEWLAPSVRE